jgi:hypothetical protein
MPETERKSLTLNKDSCRRVEQILGHGRLSSLLDILLIEWLKANEKTHLPSPKEQG